MPYVNGIFQTGPEGRTTTSDWTNRNQSSVTGSVDNNVSAIPQIAQLTSLIAQIQQNTNNSRIPGAAGLQAQSSGNIASALGGQLDPSVINQIGQRAAERGVMTGSPNGANTNADYLRSIGLTSLDMMNRGEGWLSGALARNPSAQFDPSSMFITPAQQAQLDMEQQRIDLARQAQSFRGHGGGGGSYGPARSSGVNVGGDFVGAPARPAINWGDLLPSPSWMDTYGVAPTQTGQNLSWPISGQGQGNNWFDDYLWDNASDVSPGWQGDINYEGFEGYA